MIGLGWKKIRTLSKTIHVCLQTEMRGQKVFSLVNWFILESLFYYIYTYTYIHLYMHTYMYTCTLIFYLHVFMYVNTCIYIYAHAHTHTHTHAHSHPQSYTHTITHYACAHIHTQPHHGGMASEHIWRGCTSHARPCNMSDTWDIRTRIFAHSRHKWMEPSGISRSKRVWWHKQKQQFDAHGIGHTGAERSM